MGTTTNGGDGSKGPFDLLENNFSDGSPKRDLNGLLMNPQWAAQQYASPPFPDPSDTVKCSRPDFSDCTDKDKPVIDKASLCTIFNCGVGTISAGHSPWARVPGHVNWKAATYTGKACFNDYSFDFDYTLNLMTARGAGLTLLNSPNEKNTGFEPLAMHTEFDARETVNNFNTDYWKNLRDLIGDQLALDCGHDPTSYPCTELNNKRAIEIGLVGLDTGHSGYSELHPVYALAVETSKAEDGSASTWILFARNRGDEGDCSHLDHRLSCDNSKLEDSLRLFIPAPLRKQAAGAHLLDGTQFASNYGSGANCPAFTFGHYGNDDGILVELRLPPGKYDSPEDGPLIEGVLRIAWDVKGDAPSSDWDFFTALPACGAVPIIREEPPKEIKAVGNTLLEKLEPIDKTTTLKTMDCKLDVFNSADSNIKPAGPCEGRPINVRSPLIKDLHERLKNELEAIITRAAAKRGK